MGSSKSAHLLMTGFNFEEHGKLVWYIKPSIDTRDSKYISSRTGMKHECILFSKDANIFNLIDEHFFSNKGVILVDECQFLTEAQVDQIVELVDKKDCLVICYGLRTDCNSHLFPGSKRLFEVADTFEEIKSTCDCGHKTIINAKYTEEGFVLSNTQVDIGGNDKYKAVCRKCWYEQLLNP